VRSVTLVDATDVALWANRRDAQAILPQVLRRLVHATTKRVIRVGFPAGEGVLLGGWDGLVVVDEGNAFVPGGTSAWEMGANRNIKDKADGDYEKRRADPGGIDPAQSTFIFVTPRRWGSKSDWVGDRQAEGLWREVRAYDADDLETWLELAPAVHVWLSILLGRHPENAVDLGNIWADWSETTRPAMTAELVLAGRGEAVERIHAWLRNAPGSLAVQAEARDEALAVFAAAVQQLPLDERVDHLSRALVVRDLSAWHRLTAAEAPLILAPVFDSRDAIARATRAGHQVLVTLGRADSASAATVTVPRLSRDEAAKALIAAGMSEDRARDLATLARRSLTSLRRKLAESPEVQQPAWARPSEARRLLPPMLAGAWSDGKEADRQALAALCQVPYEELGESLVRWSNESDPPVRRIGDAWFVVSKEDAWSLLARYVTRGDVERFGDVVLDALGTPDPRFDLPDDRRWMAGALGHVPRYSGLLLEGIADTLAVMGARGDTVAISAGASASDYAARSVRQLLERANSDWRVWASLSDVLPLLAEAAPDAFLAGVDKGLAGEPPVLLRLFVDQGNPLFSSTPHVGLLFALETLAWSPQHLGNVALLLARLARIDPGGTLDNRPQNSLRQIFLLWYPQTAASLDQRLRVIDTLREREPEVAWPLQRQLLPDLHSVAHDTPRPRWREWTPDPIPAVTSGECSKGIAGVVTRMLADVGENGIRWRDLIEALDAVPADQHEVIVGRLASIDAERLQPPDRALIWNALRRLISQHRSFPDADWALPRERVDRLATLYQRFEPREPVGRYAWLFRDMPEFPEGREDDLAGHQEAVATARLNAVRAVHATTGLTGLLQLATQVEQPGEVGVAVGRSELLEAEEDALLRDYLAGTDSAQGQFGRGFAMGRIWERGRDWAEAKLTGVGRGWSATQRAHLLVCLLCDRRTIDLVDGLDPETQRRYWRSVGPYGIREPDDVERATRKLLEHGRPFRAVKLLSLHATGRTSPPATLIAEALEAAARVSPDEDRPVGPLGHDAARLLDVLEASTDVAAKRAAELEWAFLPVLGRHERAPRLLHRELARNPDFFAELVARVFRAEGEEPREASEEERARVRRGYELLDRWRTPPGLADGGTIDGEILKDWVRRARAVAATTGHGAVADRRIGHVLSGSPNGPDELWPHPAVRDAIEEVQSADLERGFELGVYNSRGVTSRHPTEGGAQERKLADRYAGFAVAMGDRWPRTAAMLRRIADGYRAQGLREDQEAELGEDLGR
jgi:hypothetical protein